MFTDKVEEQHSGTVMQYSSEVTKEDQHSGTVMQFQPVVTKGDTMDFLEKNYKTRPEHVTTHSLPQSSQQRVTEQYAHYRVVTPIQTLLAAAWCLSPS